MGGRKRSDEQLQLFDLGPRAENAEEAGGIGPAPVSAEVEELGRELPRGVYLGGSTWSFPGWAGLVYDREYPQGRLAREGLAAYAKHPLLRAIGVDRTHYAPVAAAELARYAEQVPDDFRFLVKAHEACTLTRYPDHPRYGAQRGQPNPLYLDPAYAAEQVVAPYVEGLGEKGGALLFQFAPQDVGTPAGFAAELRAFLTALPRGPVYAVELRNRELLTPEYADALAAAGACHCHNAYPRMPEIRVQARLAGSDGSNGGPATIVRWLLAPGMTYEAAGRLYAPFNRLAAVDENARRAIAELTRDALSAGRPAIVTVNNNAEGSAPLSIEGLAREIVRVTRGG